MRDGDQTFLFVRDGKRYYCAVVKSTRSGETLYLTSYRLTNAADVRRVMQRGSVVKNDLGK